MRLRINLLFVVDSRRREEIYAECTVDSSCLRTAKPGVPIPSSGGMFEWPDRSGLLEFTVPQDATQTFRVGLFDRVRGDEEVPFGFCVLSGNQGFETVPIQVARNEGDERHSASACFEVRWLPNDDPVESRRGDGSQHDFSIIARLEPLTVSQVPTSQSSSSPFNEERFWFSYNYCRCEVRTDVFTDLHLPRFQPIADTFRIRATARDVNELLFNCPLVIRLFSSLRGVIAVAVLVYRNQSARSAVYAWNRNQGDDQLPEIRATLELASSSASQPTVQPLAVPQASTVPVNLNEVMPPPPPPPPPPPSNPSSESRLVIETELKHRERALIERESELQIKIKKIQEQRDQLAKMEADVHQTLFQLEKEKAALRRKEEDLARKHEQREQDLKLLEKRIKEEADHRVALEQFKMQQLQAQLKNVTEASDAHRKRAKRLEAELVAFHDKHATSQFGTQEKEIARLRGQVEYLKARVEEAEEETQKVRKAKDEEIFVLSTELQTMRLHGEALKHRPRKVAETESSLREQLRGLKADKEAIKTAQKSILPPVISKPVSVAKKRSVLDSVNRRLYNQRTYETSVGEAKHGGNIKESDFFASGRAKMTESGLRVPDDLEELKQLANARETLSGVLPEGEPLLRHFDEQMAQLKLTAQKNGLM